jgi:catechol 2,3-dioxygenase-like lactoylglutathione lyase family enzyme
MGVHHMAFATRDAKANHDFYTRSMGFRLERVEVGKTEGGWAKHLFYDTGEGSMIAFWDLHDPTLPAETPSAISTALGLPIWINHLAFTAHGLDDLAKRRERWLEAGHDVMEIDHGWCTSIYTTDPNGILVEFCATTRAFTDEDRREAERLLHASDPGPIAEPKQPTIHRAKR